MNTHTLQLGVTHVVTLLGNGNEGDRASDVGKLVAAHEVNPSHISSAAKPSHILSVVKPSHIMPVTIFFIRCAPLCPPQMGWTHLPLSGGKLQDTDDPENLRRLSEVLELLDQGETVLLHCAAGSY
jgi:hypothetical protein